jgi:hypothetical protein
MRFLKAVGRRIAGVVSRIHDGDGVREIYGDNPNHISEDERLVADAVASNTVQFPGNM